MVSSTKSSRKSAEAKEEEETIILEFKTMNPDGKLRPELKEKIQKWILSFYHLDPRYKILTFFNLVASEGADNVTDDQIDTQGINSSTKSAPVGRGAANGGGERASSHGSSISSSSEKKSSINRTGLMTRASARHIRPSTLSLLSSLFSATSILTVWRPCSNDAMRKMMEGTGVGKGLDIKGKSAKKGSLSAFVPFMQIFHNDHKNEIQPIGESAEMRIYYKNAELRDYVFEVLEKFLQDGRPPKKKLTRKMKMKMMKPPSKISRETSVIATWDAQEMVDEAMVAAEAEGSSSLFDYYESDEEEEGDENPGQLPPHKDPLSPMFLCESSKLKKIKKFVKTGYYGIECSQRLFWFATVHDADINRVGTGTQTGRPSLPGFQDANLKTLKVAQSQLPKPTPMPVVLQNKSLEDIKKDLEAKQDFDEENDVLSLETCLDPRHLLMAYEEQGTIKPVVSDFDGFLLGWRREALWFGCLLPRDQESLMMWSVDQIELILEEQKKNPTNSDSWTIRWLDVLKKAAAEGFSPEVPEYGFGDPKSTSIMEHAALKLQSTGAVRHGSECFNYHFPQEIDEMFLLISDTLKPVPWKYVNVKDLQTILSKKIAEGFVFPLNPKWILCDPGWKKIYDDLMASDALYADLSKDVWFPPYSGIRDRIEQIHKRHPEGFQRCTDPTLSKNSKPVISGGRRASNLLRETLEGGLGSELTGNAFADLAQLELDDFVARTSKISIGSSDLSKDMLAAAHASLTIEELEDEDHSSSEARASGALWNTPRKKRLSAASHSSSGSHGSDRKPNSSRSAGGDNRQMGSSSHHGSGSGSHASAKGLRKLLRGAAQSTRKIISTRPTRNYSRNMSPGMGFNESLDEGLDLTPRTNSRSQSNKTFRGLVASSPQLDIHEELDGFRNLNPEQKMAKSTILNKEPRRNFTKSKWGKIRTNVKKSSK